jgi:cytochrome P450
MLSSPAKRCAPRLADLDTSKDPGPAASPAVFPPFGALAAAQPPRVVTDPARVREILADPGYTVPDPGCVAPPRTMHWLRQNVARFSNGTDHARRRELAESLLRPLDTSRRWLPPTSPARRTRARPTAAWPGWPN